MEKNTFGSSDKIKSLVFLTEKIDLLDKNKKGYVSSLINDFNRVVKETNQHVKNTQLKKYFFKLILHDFESKLDKMKSSYDKNIISYLRNFFVTKLKLENEIL